MFIGTCSFLPLISRNCGLSYFRIHLLGSAAWIGILADDTSALTIMQGIGLVMTGKKKRQDSLKLQDIIETLWLDMSSCFATCRSFFAMHFEAGDIWRIRGWKSAHRSRQWCCLHIGHR